MSYEFEQRVEAEAELIVDYGEYGYSWDIVQVYRRKSDGRLFMLGASGCSCYGPFDDIGAWEDMEPVNSFDTVRRALDELYTGKPSATDVIEAMRLVETALKEAK